MEQLGEAKMQTASPPNAAQGSARMASARRQFYSVSLWLARLSQSYIPSDPHQQHLRLRWLADKRSLSTQPFSDHLTLELKLPDLHLQFMEHGRPVPHVFDAEDRTPAATEAWILVELLHRGIDRKAFSKSLPFETADLMSGDSESYAPDSYEAELSELTGQLSAGIAVLDGLAKELGATDGVWIAPETMHAGIAIVPQKPPANGGARVRIGFSLGDERIGESYFYVVPQDHGTIRSLRPGTVLTATQIAASAMTPAAVRAFLRDAAAGTKPA
jgi:hypothetical protein